MFLFLLACATEAPVDTGNGQLLNDPDRPFMASKTRHEGTILVSDLRMVVKHYQDSSHSSEDIVHVDDVDAYVEAAVRLHFNPGINPHSGGETMKIERIMLGTPHFSGPYWHTTPSLQHEDANENGAATLSWNFETIWRAPEPTISCDPNEQDCDIAAPWEVTGRGF